VVEAPHRARPAPAGRAFVISQGETVIAHNDTTSNTGFINLEPITLALFEKYFQIADVYSPDDWDRILEVDQTCIWVTLMANDRKVTDGSEMVIATISPETDTIFGDRDVVCYFRTTAVAANYMVNLTITDLISLGMNLNPEIISALKVLDAMKAGTDQPHTDRDMRPGGVSWTPKWNLSRIRETAYKAGRSATRSVNPYTDEGMKVRGMLRNFGRAALDLGIELLPYIRVFTAGVVVGRLIEAGAREAAEQAKK
jgi:hypothetical protein